MPHGPSPLKLSLFKERIHLSTGPSVFAMTRRLFAPTSYFHLLRILQASWPLRVIQKEASTHNSPNVLQFVTNRTSVENQTKRYCKQKMVEMKTEMEG